METKSKTVWDAFGSYVARVMKTGKGVAVPKFGIFTFSAMNVDLAGSTNPQVRDRQERFPVFVVSKDFVGAFPMSAGIAAGMNLDVYEDQADRGVRYAANQIRIFNQQSVNGIIPKVKINYAEIANITGGSASKDQCKDLIESIIYDYSMQVRQGKPVKSRIPNVGNLIIKNSVAGVIFEQALIDYSRGQTAKNFEFIFGGNNWMNNKIYKPNTGDFGVYAEDLNTNEAVLSPQQNLRVSHDAVMWLKKNLDMDLNQFNNQNLKEISSPQVAKKNTFQEDISPLAVRYSIVPENKSYFNTPIKAQSNMVKLKQRPQSASAIGRLDNRRSSVINSRASSRQGSAITRVPELAPFQLMNLANEIFSYRTQIIDAIRNRMAAISLRDLLSSSKIQKVMLFAGIKISIGNLKAVLKELGFNFNGPSCSIKDLLQRVKEYCNPEMNYNIRNEYQTQDMKTVDRIAPADQVAILGMKVKNGSKGVVEIIRELFYSTNQTMYEIFKQVSQGDTLNIESFIALINQYSHGTMPEDDIKLAFESVCKSPYKDKMSYIDFEAGFKIFVPLRGSLQNETVIIQKVREWMFMKQYASQGAFERLIRSVDRLAAKNFRRIDFHQALITNKVGLSAPEIDFLFDLMGQGSELIVMDNWLSKIFDDALNPLQLIRELVFAEQMDTTDVLFQMKLKVWDDSLNYKQFSIAIRRIDQSFSDSQCLALFNKLKNANKKVEIQTLVSNITGSENDTVDFKHKIFKALYKEVFSTGKRKLLLKLFENYDSKNDGKIKPEDLEACLKQITGGAQSIFSDDNIRKFVRQINRDEKNNIAYVEFMDRTCALGNKNHNPLKSIIQRLTFFMESNKVNVVTLLARLGGTERELVSVDKFVDFLKAKVDKRRDASELYGYALQMDVDNDGCISADDLKTCLENSNFHGFYEQSANELDNGEITDSKIIAVLECIRKVMRTRKILCAELFKTCDTEKVGFINKAQFVRGISSVVKIASPLLEKMFLIMDSNKIGMVDYEKFEVLIKAMAPSQIPRTSVVEDSFSWQEQIIQKIKDWIQDQQLGAEEAFRQFDQDFDGLISPDDMKKSLQAFIRVKPEEINDSRIERLFRLMSFFKTQSIQPSDFERLLNDVNPYVTAATNQTLSTFKTSMGGGFIAKSTNDWKFAALQQVGLIISKKYDHIEDSFMDASGNTAKVDFASFMNFVDKHDALKGFNLTAELKQKLFAEIDPHKKSFVTLKDWLSAFGTFDEVDHIMVEFKNFVQSQFVDCKAAYEFVGAKSKTKVVDFGVFSGAVRSMLASRKLSEGLVKSLFLRISRQKNVFDSADFEEEFKNIQFNGKQGTTKATNLVKTTVAEDAETSASSHPASSSDWITSLRGTRTQRLAPKTHSKGNNLESRWEADALDKLKRLIKSTGKSLDLIFRQIDSDGSGFISREEFHRALKMISLGLTNMEIQKLMDRVDANNDGQISYVEFAAKFREDPIHEEKMVLRANTRLVQLNELMILHMDSAQNAYRLFDTSRAGRMSVLDLDKLVNALMKLAKKPVPCYAVIKDMFDALDRNKDQVLDPEEWLSAFGGLRVVPETSAPSSKTVLTAWEQSHEASKLSSLIAKNHRALLSGFKMYSTHSDHQGESRFVTYAQAKKALEPMIKENFTKKGKDISDEQLQVILKVGLVSRAGITIYDFVKILDTYTKREQDAQFLG